MDNLCSAHIKCTFAKLYDAKNRYIFTLQAKDFRFADDNREVDIPIMFDVNSDTPGELYEGYLTKDAYSIIQQKILESGKEKIKNSTYKHFVNEVWENPAYPTKKILVPADFHSVVVRVRKEAVELEENEPEPIVQEEKKLPWWALIAGVATILLSR